MWGKCLKGQYLNLFTVAIGPIMLGLDPYFRLNPNQLINPGWI